MSFTSRIASAAARGYGMFRIAAAAAVDPFFNYVTALLHGNGTNGAQNNTFLDSSTNNFTITRNGNTTQGTFAPYGANWSNYFNGSSYITTPNVVALSADFTIETWVYYPNSINSGFYVGAVNVSGYGYWCFYYNTSVSAFRVVGSSSGTYIQSPSVTLQPNQWIHVAVTRSGSTVTWWVNGTSIGTTTNSTNWTGSASTTYIGSIDGTNQNFTGYLSNLRVVVGTAVYTSNFTPSTAPLTAISGTWLLTAKSNRFLDSSTNNYALTSTGTSVQVFSPFNLTSAYSTSSNGGSGYFDGSGDYLQLADSTAWDLTGDYTIEMWLYITSIPASPTFFQIGDTSNYLLWYLSSGTKYLTLTGSVGITASTALNLNSWNHIALVRSGSGSNNTVMYLNGVNVGQTTNNTSFTGSASNGVRVGAEYPSGYYVNGYISDVRVVKGTAVYTAAFTPPTAPLTAITNTQLLTNFTNAGIFDNAMMGDYETVGDAQISTTQSKFGGSSIYFDGTGDCLYTTTQTMPFGTGDFTIEFWIYFNAVNNGVVKYIYDFRNAGATASSFLAQEAANTWTYYNGAGTSSTVLNSTIFSASTWYHFAVCRVAGTTRFFVNGTQISSIADTSNYATSTFVFGARYTTVSDYLNGYIDDLRITKGVGRYPYNFTPPTAAFPNIGGTVTLTADPYFNYTTLLLPGNGTNGAQNNTFLDSSTNNFTITRNGNTTQGTFAPYGANWSNYFDGSGDYLSAGTTSSFNFLHNSTALFTIEAWVYVTAGSLFNTLIDTNAAGSAGIGCWFVVNTDNKIRIFIAKGSAGNPVIDASSSSAISLNQWVHVAVTYDQSLSSNNATFYINGVATGNGTKTANAPSNSNATYALQIGAYNTPSGYFNGYISNLRINNSIVYNSAFTPSTTPLTAIANTSLLTCQSNRFIDNSSNAFTITRNGDVSVQRFSPFSPTAAYSASTIGGSGYFDGSGDYLTFPNNAVFAFGTGAFTIEGWVNSNALNDKFILSGRAAIGTMHITYGGFGGSTIGCLRYVGSSTITSGSVLISNNAWNHFAIVRDGSNNITLYVNGVSVGTGTDSTSYTTTSGTWYINANDSGPTAGGAGYIADLRIVKGTAVYTSAFTPPTAPLTAITNTSFLFSCTNAGVIDNAMMNDLETVGNAQISTTQSKWGGSSVYFDGTGDWLYSPSSNLYSIGSGDFTVEYWLYLTANFTSAGSGMVTAAYDTNWNILGYNSGSGNIVRFYVVNSFIDSSTAITLNTWTHVAVTRSSNTARIFINGTQTGTGTLSGTGGNSALYVGTNSHNTAQTMTGYIDDLRITKGIARYTSNFTPPTSAFLLQ